MLQAASCSSCRTCLLTRHQPRTMTPAAVVVLAAAAVAMPASMAGGEIQGHEGPVGRAACSSSSSNSPSTCPRPCCRPSQAPSTSAMQDGLGLVGGVQCSWPGIQAPIHLHYCRHHPTGPSLLALGYCWCMAWPQQQQQHESLLQVLSPSGGRSVAAAVVAVVVVGQ